MTPAEHKAWFLGLPVGETRVAVVNGQGDPVVAAVWVKRRRGRCTLERESTYDRKRYGPLRFEVSEKTGKVLGEANAGCKVVPFTPELETYFLLRNVRLFLAANLGANADGGRLFKVSSATGEQILTFLDAADAAGFLNHESTAYTTLQSYRKAYEDHLKTMEST